MFDSYRKARKIKKLKALRANVFRKKLLRTYQFFTKTLMAATDNNNNLSIQLKEHRELADKLFSAFDSRGFDSIDSIVNDIVSKYDEAMSKLKSFDKEKTAFYKHAKLQQSDFDKQKAELIIRESNLIKAIAKFHEEKKLVVAKYSKKK